MKYYKLIKNEKLLRLFSVFIKVGAITLWPFIIVSPEYDNVITLNHERIHLEQQKELLLVLFYVLYIYYWVKNRVQGMNNFEAYCNIPFEKEAYDNQENLDYLDTRKHYAWNKKA